MNVRTQITLDPEMQRRAQARAEQLGISFAEYVRRLVSSDLGEPRPKVDISAVFNLVKGGPKTNIAKDKNKMIGEAVYQEFLRETGRKDPRSSKARRERD